MQNRMLIATDVLIHRHPVIHAFGHHGRVTVRIAIAHEIPGTVNKGVHRVGFASALNAANRAHHTFVKAFMAQQWVTRAVGHAVQWQHDRQIGLGHRHRAMHRAMDDRNRRAPIALAADAPVAQAKRGFALAQAFGGQRIGDRCGTRLDIQAVKRSA